jgi:hypothetical protein
MRTKKVRKSRQTFRSVDNVVGNRADGHVSDMRADNPVSDSVGISVGNAVGNPSVNVAKSRNFFATLCEIPTGYIPSVYPSVKR